MDHHRTPSRPRPHLLSTSAPARPVSTSPTQHQPSQSPFRYVHFPEMSEKGSPLGDMALDRVASTSRHPASPMRSARPSAPSSPAPHASPLTRSRLRIPLVHRLKPWAPLIIYGLSSFTFVVSIAFFKTQLFTFLDNLSIWLRADAHFGYAVLFALIFLTTFPPIPLYSTLIVLSGYTFGPWIGATLSYLAALSGALTVFVISRTLLRTSISRWLDSACTIKRVVRAVEKRPKLLFLVRLAPYPYNLLNCLLAASPTLTLKTYTLCTAASLFKVIVHTSVGASIHSFKDYHSDAQSSDDDAGSAGTVARVFTIGGIVLCIAIFVYISIVARRAVDEELGDDDDTADAEERAGFLANVDDPETGARPMVEFRR